MNAPSSETSSAPFRFVDVCPECGYSLAGLPEEGKCPECGNGYDQSVVILHGGAMGNKANLGNASPRQFWFMTFWMLVWFCQSYFFGSPNDYGFLLLAAIWVPLLGRLIVRRLSNQRPGLIQVYLSPHGCLQVENATDPPAIIMIRRLIIPMLALIALTWVLISVDGIRRILWGGALSIVLVAACILQWYRNEGADIPTRKRRAAETLFARGHRWNGKEIFTCKVTREGFVRLSIWKHCSWYEFKSEYVDAEIACGTEKCDEIAKSIIQWISENRQRQ